MARRPDLLSLCLGIVHRAISGFYKQRAKQAGISEELKTGAVTFIQRFGSSLNLNPHFHMLLMEGGYEIWDKHIKFRRIKAPTDDDIAKLVDSIATRVLRALHKRGFSFDDAIDSQDHDLPQQLDLYPQLQAASVQSISLLDRHGKRLHSLGSLPLDPPMPDPARAPPQLSFSDVDAGTFDDSADFDQRSPENY